MLAIEKFSIRIRSLKHNQAIKESSHGRQKRQEGQGESAKAEGRQTSQNRKAETEIKLLPNFR